MSYPDALEDLIDDIYAWQCKTFPHSTVESKFKHLQSEIAELGNDLTKPGEIADCLFLLIDMARTQGYDVQRILSDKFKINRERQWGQPDDDGVVEHVSDTTADANTPCAESKVEGAGNAIRFAELLENWIRSGVYDAVADADPEELATEFDRVVKARNAHDELVKTLRICDQALVEIGLLITELPESQFNLIRKQVEMALDAQCAVENVLAKFGE